MKSLFIKHKSWAIFFVLFVLVQGLYLGLSRKKHELQLPYGKKLSVYRTYDLRGENVETKRKKTEHAYYQVKGSFSRGARWPGLGSFEFAITWLRILVSVYDEASFEGDFSWLFHKLRFISHLIPDSEASFRAALMPLFVVLGKDPAGALYLLNEKLARSPNAIDWRLPYWAGFHALENLKEPQMAGDFFLMAAHYGNSPQYLATLGFRLKNGDVFYDKKLLRKEAIDRLDDELKEKLKHMRPEWFE
jgi:hypothetical protein